MQKYSLLDLSPIPEGGTPADALANSASLALAAEKFGYHRYWLAEHHNMPGIASAATISGDWSRRGSDKDNTCWSWRNYVA